MRKDTYSEVLIFTLGEQLNGVILPGKHYFIVCIECFFLSLFKQVCVPSLSTMPLWFYVNGVWMDYYANVLQVTVSIYIAINC